MMNVDTEDKLEKLEIAVNDLQHDLEIAQEICRKASNRADYWRNRCLELLKEKVLDKSSRT